jgi:hypothetical protein
MPRSDVVPYFLPQLDVWSFSGWELREGEEWTELPDWIDGWDSDSDVHLRAMLTVDLPRLRLDCNLDVDSHLILTVSWLSSSSLMTGTVYSSEISDKITGLGIHLPANQIGGIVTLITTVCLRDDTPNASPGAARFAGSVLLRDETRVAVEGNAALFPVAVVDFAATPFNPLASWKLEVSDELAAPFLGGFQLLLNSRDAELVRAVTRGTGDAAAAYLLDELETGVAALLTEIAFELKSDLEARAWEPESIGSVLTRYLHGVQDAGIRSVPSDARELADFRSQIGGVVRSLSMGRAFE